MKTKLTKIISMLIAAAIVLGSGFTAIPKPTSLPDNSIVIIEIDSDDDKSCNEVNDTDPPFDDPEVEILQ